MAKFDFDGDEGDGELSDCEDDDQLRDEIASLSSVFLPSKPAVDGDFNFSSDDDDGDLELVRSIKQRYGCPEVGAEGSDRLKSSLSPLTDDDDDDDDFETLRAIRTRFGQYSIGNSSNGDCSGIDINSNDNNGNDNCVNECPSSCIDDDDDDDDLETLRAIKSRFSVCSDAKSSVGSEDGGDNDVGSRREKESDGSFVNEWRNSCEDVDNREEGGGHTTSGFPKVALRFIEAINKNRSCQKLIRAKLLSVKARLEKLKDLERRVRTVVEYQLKCRKKLARGSLSRGWVGNAYMRLISSPRKRVGKGVVSAMCYGPVENSQAACYRSVLERFPVSFHRDRWSEEERESLEKGIRQQFQEMLLLRSADDAEEAGNGVDSMMSLIRNVEFTPEMMREFCVSGNVNWEKLASMYLTKRSGAECEARWVNFENPLIKKDKEWTAMEEKTLLLLIQQNGMNNWRCIAEKMRPFRTPFQCLSRYQSSLNCNMLNRNWTEEEDDQLFIAVETFGERNWQAVASMLVGRTGKQCADRWVKILNPARKRVGRWSLDEDRRLRVAVTLFSGDGKIRNWHKIEGFVSGRTQVQCRERWVNALDPSLRQGAWTEEEDLKLKAALEEQRGVAVGEQRGYCWSKIAACVPSRTDNHCLRRWKALFPDEDRLLQAARETRKAALPTNFVDRESRRTGLGAIDFVPLGGIGSSTVEPGNESGPQKRRRRRRERGPCRVTGETAACSTSKEVRPRKSRKRATSKKGNVTGDCGDKEICVDSFCRNTRKRARSKKVNASSECGDEGICVL